MWTVKVKYYNLTLQYHMGFRKSFLNKVAMSVENIYYTTRVDVVNVKTPTCHLPAVLSGGKRPRAIFDYYPLLLYNIFFRASRRND